MSSEDYRYYRLDGDGHIHGAEWISAANDEQAIEHIRASHPDAKCEIWQATRLVVKLVPSTFNPDDPHLQNNVAKRLSRLAHERRSRPDA